MLASIAFATALAAASCGSDDPADAAKGTVADASTTSAAIDEAASTTAPPTTESPTTESTTTTVQETTTTAAASPAVAGPQDGVLFVEPDQGYSLLIGPEWTADGSLGSAFQLWFTGVETPGFAENVNILTEAVPTSTPIEGVLEASQGQIEAQFENFSLIRSEVVVGQNHPELGLLEYTATSSGLDGRFIQIFGIWDNTLVVLTGSTDASLGSEGIERLEPYALTLAPAG